MGSRLLGVVERLCALPFALTLALSRGERGKEGLGRGEGRKAGERFLSFVETFAPFPFSVIPA